MPLKTCSLVDPYTTSRPELEDLRRCAEMIQPDRVQLNTVTRPPAESRARSVAADKLAEIARTFRPPAEVIAEHLTDGEYSLSCGREEILDLLRRRPCTIADIAAGLKMHPAEVVKLVESLSREKLLESCSAAGRLHYRAAMKRG